MIIIWPVKYKDPRFKGFGRAGRDVIEIASSSTTA